MEATFAVVKRKPEKIQACKLFEPLTSVIPAQRFTICDNKPTGSRSNQLNDLLPFGLLAHCAECQAALGLLFFCEVAMIECLLVQVAIFICPEGVGIGVYCGGGREFFSSSPKTFPIP